MNLPVSGKTTFPIGQLLLVRDDSYFHCTYHKEALHGDEVVNSTIFHYKYIFAAIGNGFIDRFEK